MNKLPDEICIAWHIEDVHEAAKNIGVSLTNDQAREVLQRVKNNHDASIGVNWDSIQADIDFYMEGQNEKDNH